MQNTQVGGLVRVTVWVKFRESVCLRIRVRATFSIRLVLLFFFAFLPLHIFAFNIFPVSNIVCLDDVCRVKSEGFVN